MPGTATLTFTINDFIDLSTGNLMTAAGPGAPRSPNVNFVQASGIAGGANVAIADDGTVTITGGLDLLTIAVAGTYNPVVLFFNPQGNAPASATTFGPYQVDSQGANTTLSVFDRGSGGSTYEFYVLVRTPQGGYGLIDPRIINNT